MLARTLIAALLAGMLAGLAITPVQSLKTTPLILAAEVFEDGGAPAHDHAAGLSFVTPAMAHGVACVVRGVVQRVGGGKARAVDEEGTENEGKERGCDAP